MAAVLPGSQPRRDTVFQRLRALALRAEVANPLTRPPLAAADAWAPGTAYRLGEVVSNGGNLYECFNFSGGTSAASGGPTGTSDNSVDDGTVRWIYAGTSLTSATSPIGPTVIAHFNGLNPPSEYGLVDYYLVNPDWGNGRTVETLIKPIGGSAFVQAGEQWRFSSSTLFPDQNGNIGPGRSGTLGGFELITDAPVFAPIWSFPKPFRLFVDGMPAWPGARYGGAGNGACGPVISIPGGRRERHVRIEFNGSAGLFGVVVDPSSSIHYPHEASSERLIVLGDSQTGQAADFPVLPVDLAVNLFGKSIGIPDSRPSPIGSTGYTTRGQGFPKPIERLNDLAGATLAGFAFGLNDTGSGPSATTAAALATFQAARLDLPGVPILVWGVTNTPGNTMADAIAQENAVFAAVAQASDPLLIPIPISTDPDPWFTPANVGVYYADTAHGNSAWHRRFASRSADTWRKIVAGRA